MRYARPRGGARKVYVQVHVQVGGEPGRGLIRGLRAGSGSWAKITKKLNKILKTQYIFLIEGIKVNIKKNFI